MPYNVNYDSGMAERNSWVQVTSADYDAIEQGSSSYPCSARHYAQLVEVVGGINLSAGDLTVGLSALEEINTGISALTQQIYDKVCDIDTSISASNVYLEAISGTNDVIAAANKDYSSIIRVSGSDPSFTWIAKSDPGADPVVSASVWQVKQVYEDGQDVDIKWANGSTSFTNPASALSALIYTY